MNCLPFTRVNPISPFLESVANQGICVCYKRCAKSLGDHIEIFLVVACTIITSSSKRIAYKQCTPSLSRTLFINWKRLMPVFQNRFRILRPMQRPNFYLTLPHCLRDSIHGARKPCFSTATKLAYDVQILREIDAKRSILCLKLHSRSTL